MSQHTLSLPKAATIAFVLEGLTLFAVLTLVTMKVKEVVEQRPVTQISLQPPVENVPPVVQPPVPVVKKVQPVMPKVEKSAAVAPIHQDETKSVETVQPSPLTPPAPPAPAVPQVTEASVVNRIRFGDKIRMAVQAALIYPRAAKDSHVTGKTQVGFTFLDGQASDPHVLITSGRGMLDRAAIAAVMAAHFPLPDPEYLHKTVQFEIWVQFLLSDNPLENK